MHRTLVALLLLPLAASARTDTPRPPNVLLILADDLGWKDVGYHGSDIRTPNIDKLARAGVRLERHYVYPTCSPTRAGILTGRNPSRFGILAPIAERSKQALPTDTPTLAGVLRQHGYDTGLAGKWHLGLRPEVGPRKYGFASSYGYLHGQIDQLTHRYKNGDRSWHRNETFLDEKGHATDLIAAEAVRFLQRQRKVPFFLWVAFSVPHHPLQEEAKWLAPYTDTVKDPSRRLYAASVAHLDHAIGQIARALEKTGQARDTLLVFTSDNGAQRNYSSKTDYGGQHGPNPTLGDNRPWRGWKGSLYEGGIRVPAFVSWPGTLKPGVVKATVSYLDWLPTLSGRAGARLPEKLEGRTVWPLLAGEKAPPAAKLYWHTPRDRAVLVGDWKLIVPKKGKVQLYHLADDPAEAKDLAGKQVAKQAELEKFLTEQKKQDEEALRSQ
jgi:arylsulfatase A-like enzyme